MAAGGGAAVEGLVLELGGGCDVSKAELFFGVDGGQGKKYVVFRAAMSVARTAPVEIPIGSRTGAAHASGRATADIDVWDGRDVGRGRGMVGGGGGFQRGLGDTGARGTAGTGAGKGFQAVCGIAVSEVGVTPAVLGAWWGESVLAKVWWWGEKWMREMEGMKGVEAEGFPYSNFLQHILCSHIEVHSFGQRL